MPELVESTAGVESLPHFTGPSRQRWASIPADIRQRLPSNAWCGQCRHETTVSNFSGAIKDGDLPGMGKYAECQGDVARVIEGLSSGQASNAVTTSRCATHSAGSGLRGNHSTLMHRGGFPARIV